MELEKFGKSDKGMVKMKNSSLNSFQDKLLDRLYNTAVGRILIRPLINPMVSKIGGKVLSLSISCCIVKPFIKLNHIDISDCENKKYTSFNDFFTRKLIDGARRVCEDANSVIAPCDGRLTVYPITDDGLFTVKHTGYSLKELLKSEKLAKRYQGGTLWMYRLCVDDYHRYIYPVDARKSKNVHIPGVFHTVNPVANDIYPIYKENTREYCLLKTETAGTFLQMEVGALMVGKIENNCTRESMVKRGDEKGYFAFGGSTIIILTQKDCAVPGENIRSNSVNNIETRVKLGQIVGRVR